MTDAGGQCILLDVPRCESSDERYTPTALFRRLTEGVVLDLDVSATRESAKCGRYYSLVERAENGLLLPWDAPAWNNPPWSDIEPWMKKTREEILSGRCPLLYQLLPSWTDRDWWHIYVEPYRDGRCLVCRGIVSATGFCQACWGAGRAGTTGHVATLTTQFLRRERFGRPGDPEGRHAGSSPDFWCVLLVWRRA